MGVILSFKNNENSIELLKQHLSEVEVGYPAGPGQIVELLADAWDQFDKFDDTNMAGYKLFRRMENVTWKPPCLSFQIERHGATVLGSTRADLYTWSVDLDRRTAEIIGKNRRQLYPTAKPIRVKPIAADVGDRICKGKDDPRLTWIEPGQKVRVTLISCFPEDGAHKMTTDNRRLNLRKALNAYLNPLGWQQESPTGSPVFFKGDVSGGLTK
ncbi:MAG: hypothetical protein HN416_14830 [Nitrospina sp.]|nr:hypothetical protein [Nitrospina sp.]